MALVVDASVAVKWFVEETDHVAARVLMKQRIRRSAPDIILVEVANALRNKVRLGEISLDQADLAMETLPACFVDLVPCPNLIDRAYRLAVTVNHPVPDCMYLACAEYIRGSLVSADIAFLKKCRAAVPNPMFNISDSTSFVTNLSNVQIRDDVFKMISRLSSIVSQTFDGLKGTVEAGDPLSIRGVRNIGSVDLRPGFDSPAYNTLTRVILEMSDEEVTILLALGWLGRDYYSADRWSELLLNAEKLVAQGVNNNIQYIVAQMQRVAIGREKLIMSAKITTQ